MQMPDPLWSPPRRHLSDTASITTPVCQKPCPCGHTVQARLGPISTWPGDPSPSDPGTHLHPTRGPISIRPGDPSPPDPGPISTGPGDPSPPDPGTHLHPTRGPISTGPRNPSSPGPGTQFHRARGPMSTETRRGSPLQSPVDQVGLRDRHTRRWQLRCQDRTSVPAGAATAISHPLTGRHVTQPRLSRDPCWPRVACRIAASGDL